VQWLTACALGVGGGVIIEAVQVWGELVTWVQARRVARHPARRKRRLPRLADYVDCPAHALLLPTRCVLGGAAGLVFHAQVTGWVAAIAVGASAPALLEQLGRGRMVGGDPGGDG
jgi:hypothetical protein